MSDSVCTLKVIVRTQQDVQAVKFDIRVSLLGFFHQPPFIATLKVEVVRRVHVGGFGSVRRLRIATDFDLEH